MSTYRIFRTVNGKGQNIAGKILERVRSSDFPEYLLLGDSIIKNVNIHNVEKCCLSGGKIREISQLANLTINIPNKGLIIHAGVNDTITKSKELKNVVKVYINE